MTSKLYINTSCHRVVCIGCKHGVCVDHVSCIKYITMSMRYKQTVKLYLYNRFSCVSSLHGINLCLNMIILFVFESIAL